MGYEFRTGIREKVGLIVGLAGPSGGGKTLSAMRLAAGIAGPDKPFAVIDTEARRALHYADRFRFDHCDLRPPFRPSVYAEAIRAADQKGYPAIVIDSGSHEWAGEGGVLDWNEEELQRLAGDDWGKRERVKLVSWIKPKMAHKQFVQKLLQVRAHLIICLRAEEKVQMQKVDGKTVIVPMGFQPICARDFPFELTCSFLLTPDKPGIPQPIKLQEQHRALFPADRPIGEDSGQALAVWAAGGAARQELPPADRLRADGERQARAGMTSLEAWFKSLPRADKAIAKIFLEELKPTAVAVDAEDDSDAAAPLSGAAASVAAAEGEAVSQ